ncbi:MAG TPA: hypothetical protein VK524_32120 [Polyangiaceae bacterium]|nr:hypothetical protein [Polyangiaceae bacterium]
MGGSRAVRSASVPDERARDARDDDAALELLDVPAAVVCATCGSPDCGGCLNEDTQASGVIAIVPWERPGLGLGQRLMATARLATASSESLFGALPDGDLAPALRFAVLAELLAVTGLVLGALPVGLVVAPWLMRALLADPGLREAAYQALLSGIPGLAFAMVAIHAAHGVGLDWAARRHGASLRRGRGLRFGLYACAWDLLTLPLGIVTMILLDGPRKALTTARLGLGAPGRAARAYLRGIHHLDERQAQLAAHFALLIAAAVTVAAVLAVIAALLFS